MKILTVTLFTIGSLFFASCSCHNVGGTSAPEVSLPDLDLPAPTPVQSFK